MKVQSAGDEISDRSPPMFFIHYESTGALAAAYMPFIRNGGLLIQGAQNVPLGSKVFLRVRIAEECRPLAVTARVVWLAPCDSRNSGKGNAGMGVSLDDNGRPLKVRMESALSGKEN